jgi:hypothetical protein
MGSLALRPGDSLTILLDGFVNRLQDFQFPSFLLFKLRGFELLPRWDFHPLFMPAFAGRTLFFPPERPEGVCGWLWFAYQQARPKTNIQRFRRHSSWPSSRPLHSKHYYLLGRPRHRLCVRDGCRRSPFGLWFAPARRHAVEDMNQKGRPGECTEKSAHFICPDVAAEDHKQHNEQADYQSCIFESFHCTPHFQNLFTTVTDQTATTWTLGAGSPVATGFTASAFFAAAAAFGAVR